jgi:hypothetical protein
MLYDFLTSEDLDASIKEEMLTQLVRDNMGLVAVAASNAVSWMKDYLGQRFTVEDIFPIIGEWSAGNDYGPAVAMTLPGAPLDECFNPVGLAFYERPSAPAAGTTYTPLYARNAAGRLTNYAWHNDQCYEAIANSVGVEPGDESNPLAALAWRPRDPRDAKVVSFAVDIALFNLFKRVAPRKIPEFRVSLYNQAKEWLTLVKDGNLTPDLPRPIKPADNSDTIRWGSSPAQSYRY